MNYLYQGKEHPYYKSGVTYELVVKRIWPFGRVKIQDPGIYFGKPKPTIKYKNFAAFKEEWRRTQLTTTNDKGVL